MHIGYIKYTVIYGYNNIHCYNNVEVGLCGVMFSTWTKFLHCSALLVPIIFLETGRGKKIIC